jgi:hypothetical protein
MGPLERLGQGLVAGGDEGQYAGREVGDGGETGTPELY